MPVPASSSSPLDNYAAMSERELIFIARKKGRTLSPTAFTQLKAEFTRRGMDDAPLRFWEDAGVKAMRVSRLKPTPADRLYMLREKSKGSGDNDIETGLVARGLHPSAAKELLQNIRDHVNALDKRSKGIILKGILFIVAGGIAALFVAGLAPDLPFVLLSVPIVYGAIDIYTGFSNRKKCRDILEMLTIEERYRTETQS